jgi:CRISPR-associated protein Cas1
MTEKIVDIGANPARLKTRDGQLVIERGDAVAAHTPLEEVATLILSHSQVTVTGGALAGLMAHGGVAVVCDAHHSPVGFLLPIQGHHLLAERFAQQAEAPLPMRKRLWQQVVRAKIQAQARVLTELYGDDKGLQTFVSRVKSGDPGNVEAQAAVRYWKALFGSKEFRRRTEEHDENRYLNYGYGVLRAVTARAVCAAGLHPGLGIEHHNRYDPCPLASDLMEPFRPIVDRAVVRLIERHGVQEELDPKTKAVLLGALLVRFTVNGEERSLFDILARTASSLVQVFAGKRRALLLPEIP